MKRALSTQAVNGFKRCWKCNQTKEATQAFFNRNKRSADGFNAECRLCRTLGRASRKQESRDHWQRVGTAKLSTARAWRKRIREEMLDAYGRKCACCGEQNPIFLTLDHIGGMTDDNHPWPHLRRGTGIYGQLKKMGWPKDLYRLLCMNCNWAVRHGAQCPHQHQTNLLWKRLCEDMKLLSPIQTAYENWYASGGNQ